MNLERVSNEEKLNLCRKYYLGMFLSQHSLNECHLFVCFHFYGRVEQVDLEMFSANSIINRPCINISLFDMVGSHAKKLNTFCCCIED